MFTLRLVGQPTVTAGQPDRYGKPRLLSTWQVTPEIQYTLLSRYDKGRLIKNGLTLAVAKSCGSDQQGRHASFADSPRLAELQQ